MEVLPPVIRKTSQFLTIFEITRKIFDFLMSLLGFKIHQKSVHGVILRRFAVKDGSLALDGGPRGALEGTPFRAL